MHILLIDDDADIREVFAIILRSQGYEVEEAVDGLDALARLHGPEDSLPSLILLDLMMPRLDGEGFMRALKGDPRLRDIPVWIISGHPEAREKATELGAQGCFLKPIDLDQALAAFRRVENSRRSGSARREFTSRA